MSLAPCPKLRVCVCVGMWATFILTSAPSAFPIPGWRQQECKRSICYFSHCCPYESMLPFENRYWCLSLWPISSQCELQHLVCITMGFPLLHLSWNKNQMSQKTQQETEWKRLFCALVSGGLMINQHVSWWIVYVGFCRINKCLDYWGHCFFRRTGTLRS